MFDFYAGHGMALLEETDPMKDLQGVASKRCSKLQVPGKKWRQHYSNFWERKYFNSVQVFIFIKVPSSQQYRGSCFAAAPEKILNVYPRGFFPHLNLYNIRIVYVYIQLSFDIRRGDAVDKVSRSSSIIGHKMGIFTLLFTEWNVVLNVYSTWNIPFDYSLLQIKKPCVHGSFPIHMEHAVGKEAQCHEYNPMSVNATGLHRSGLVLPS